MDGYTYGQPKLDSMHLKKREDKTESVDMKGVGGGVNMIKTHCIKILKN